MISQDKIEEIKQKIVNNFNPKQILLIGSYASGTQNNDSDLDLLIVKDSDLPRQRRAFNIRKSLIGNRIPMDILVYTPDEFESEKNEKYSFINSALKNSRLLYDQSK
ncbi:Nucleotidyltransferase domain-containing protein [Tangfeifania diversioriginum]|uniref:Nucleotidyltransferase domain-containing protein n=1 Tax=Tangfeifania diversioriginum TaxID=1168035 RepID=A0A1M6J7Z1_9BACT|nr:nucleotidyltransferase domain-containing protein [Tangfeifania diversioriginum]SHJ42757.1 Nucleotidyltransferase domain-containing protein [Tangfeifania diversioriginum]